MFSKDYISIYKEIKSLANSYLLFKVNPNLNRPPFASSVYGTQVTGCVHNKFCEGNGKSRIYPISKSGCLIIKLHIIEETLVVNSIVFLLHCFC